MTIITILTNGESSDKKESEALISNGVGEAEKAQIEQVERARAAALAAAAARTLTAETALRMRAAVLRRRQLRLAVFCTAMLATSAALLSLYYLWHFYHSARHSVYSCEFLVREPDSDLQAQQSQIDFELGAYKSHGERGRGRQMGRGPGRRPSFDEEKQTLWAATRGYSSGFEGQRHHRRTTRRPGDAMAGHVERVQERLDVTDDDRMQLEVPQLHSIHSATILHDFSVERTAIIDNERNTCLVKPLAKSMTMQPQSLMDLFMRIMNGYYTPNVDAIRLMYRKRKAPMTEEEKEKLGPFIASRCKNMPIFELVPIDANAARVRRSVGDSASLKSSDNSAASAASRDLLLGYAGHAQVELASVLDEPDA